MRGLLGQFGEASTGVCLGRVCYGGTIVSDQLGGNGPWGGGRGEGGGGGGCAVPPWDSPCRTFPVVVVRGHQITDVCFTGARRRSPGKGVRQVR